MNVSITARLAGYVQSKVKSGRYNNASVRLARPTAEEILADLTEQQLQGIRRRVLASIEAVGRGEYTEYQGARRVKETCRQGEGEGPEATRGEG